MRLAADSSMSQTAASWTRPSACRAWTAATCPLPAPLIPMTAKRAGCAVAASAPDIGRHGTRGAMADLKLGIFGYGFIAGVHAEALAHMEGVRVEAVCGPRAEAAQAF